MAAEDAPLGWDPGVGANLHAFNTFTTPSLDSYDPDPDLVVPGIVTERAFKFTSAVKAFMRKYPEAPAQKMVPDGESLVLWFQLKPEWQDIMALFRDFQNTSVSPVRQRTRPKAASRALVGTVCLMNEFFRARPGNLRVLVVAVGRGADFRRLFLSANRALVIDTIELTRSFESTIRGWRSQGNHRGEDFFGDALGPASPLNASEQYDLVYCHLALHSVASTEPRIERLFSLLKRCLRPGGQLIGTMPNALTADVYSGLDDFTLLETLDPSEEHQWGARRVRHNEAVWVDPVIPTSAMATAAQEQGLIWEVWNTREVPKLFPASLAAGLADYNEYPSLGYFVSFRVSRNVPDVIPSAPPPSSWNLVAVESCPMEVALNDLPINYGGPVAAPDRPWLIFGEYLLKEKVDGVLGVMQAARGRVYLKCAGNIFLFDGVETRNEWTLQVEVICGREGRPIRCVLSDPLKLPGTTSGTPFFSRLLAFDSTKRHDQSLHLVDRGVWLPATPDNFDILWQGSEEGVVIQYTYALPRPYSYLGARGSMRYLKATPTVDLLHGQEWNSVRFSPIRASHGSGVGEYGWIDGSWQFLRMRPDKREGNSSDYLERLDRGIDHTEVRALIAECTTSVAKNVYYVDPKKVADGDSVSRAALIQVGRCPVVATTGRDEDTAYLRRIQGLLRNLMSQGNLPADVSELVGGLESLPSVDLEPRRTQVPDVKFAVDGSDEVDDYISGRITHSEGLPFSPVLSVLRDTLARMGTRDLRH